MCMLSGGAERVLPAWRTFLTDEPSTELALPLCRTGGHDHRGHQDPLAHHHPPHTVHCHLRVSVNYFTALLFFSHREHSSQLWYAFWLSSQLFFPACPSVASVTDSSSSTQPETPVRIPSTTPEPAPVGPVPNRMPITNTGPLPPGYIMLI